MAFYTITATLKSDATVEVHSAFEGTSAEALEESKYIMCNGFVVTVGTDHTCYCSNDIKKMTAVENE
jgi:hypothetical protein